MEHTTPPGARDWLLETLRNNVCLMTFIKDDDTERNMRGTLIPDVITKLYSNASTTYRPSSQNSEDGDALIRVFDVDAIGFRTMRPTKLVSLQTESAAALESAPVG